MEKLLELINKHKETEDTILEDNQVRIKLIEQTFLEVKKEALSINQKESEDLYHFINLNVIFDVCKILSPTEGYWELLIIKAIYFPKSMSNNEIFEIGRFTERMSNHAIKNDFHIPEVLHYKQILQGNFK